MKNIPAGAIGAFIGSRMFVGKQSYKIVSVETMEDLTQIKVEGAEDGKNWYDARIGLSRLTHRDSFAT